MLATALAAVAVACGPAGADTLAQTAHVRVYAQRGTAYGCSARARTPLGSAERITRVRLAGRFAAVQRRESYGESLRVYDLRTGRPRRVKVRVRQFTAVRFGSTGIATALGYRLEGGLGLYGTDDRDYDASGADPRFLWMRGQVLATLVDGVHTLQGLQSPSAPDGTLLTHGTIRIDVRGQQLKAGRPGAPPVVLGDAMGSCLSSPSGCEGIQTLRFASDRYVATWRVSAALGGGAPKILTVHDLETRTQREPCPNASSYVLADTGRTVCIVYGSASARVLAEGVVLDEGVKIGGLERRGDRVFWTNDGVERSAPLP